MFKFYVQNYTEEPELVEIETNDKRAVLLNWAAIHGHEAYNVFYGWDDGQIRVMDESEYAEYLAQKQTPAYNKLVVFGNQEQLEKVRQLAQELGLIIETKLI